MSRNLELLRKAREKTGLTTGELLNTNKPVSDKLRRWSKKMNAYRDFSKNIGNPDNFVDNAEHVLSKRNENTVLHGEQTVTREVYSR